MVREVLFATAMFLLGNAFRRWAELSGQTDPGDPLKVVALAVALILVCTFFPPRRSR